MPEPSQPLTIGILLIATGKYKQFVQPLIDAMEKYFLIGHRIHFYIFSDDPAGIFTSRTKASFYTIPQYKFPQATLYRYKIFTSVGKDAYKGCDYLFYLDVDMDIVAPVGAEILAPVTAVRHPGFYNGGGSWGNDPKSLSYTDPCLREHYYAGGFQGGSLDHYWAIMVLLANRIATDEANGVMAEWHDETHWNWYLTYNPIFHELPPEYCMVEQQHLREQWGIAHMQPKIVALAKDHEELRK